MVKVSPLFLDFRETHVCAPQKGVVSILNLSNQTDLQVTYAGSSSVHFYVNDFQPTRVPRIGIMSITIFFLPRVFGLLDANLTIETSQGWVIIPMCGRGVESPFGLQPWFSYRGHVGKKLIHSMVLHNPFPTTMRILDMLKRVTFVRMQSESPMGDDLLSHVTPKGHMQMQESVLWDGRPIPIVGWDSPLMIPPGESRHVTDIELFHVEQGRLTVSLYLKVDGVEGYDNRYVVVPIDYTMYTTGVQTNIDVLDLGTLTSAKQTSSHSIQVINLSNAPLHLEDIQLKNPDDNVIQIKFRKGQLMMPGKVTAVGEVKYRGLHETKADAGQQRRYLGWHSGSEQFWACGSIVLHFSLPHTNVLEIVYKARVMHGSLELRPPLSSLFLYGSSPLMGGVTVMTADNKCAANLNSVSSLFSVVEKKFSFHNTFAEPLLLYSIVFSHPCFHSPDFPVASLVLAAQSSQSFTVRFSPDSAPAQTFTASMTVATNLTEISFPLEVFSGVLEFRAEQKSGGDGGSPGFMQRIDLGLVDMDKEKKSSFVIRNPGPVPVAVMRVQVSSEQLSLRLEEMSRFRELENEPWKSQSAGFVPDFEGPLEVAASYPAGDSAQAKKAAGLQQTGGSPECVNCALFTIGGGYEARLLLSVHPRAVVKFEESIAFETKHERRRVAVGFEAVSGTISLSPTSITFPSTFQNKTHASRIHVLSKYSRVVKLTGARSSDPRVIPKIAANELKPGVLTHVGEVVFDPSQEVSEDSDILRRAICREEQAAGEAACEWAKEVGEEEVAALRQQQQQWRQRVSRGENQVAANVVLESELGDCGTVDVKAGIIWPRVSLHVPGVTFPLVQVGKSADMAVRVVNPSDHPVRMMLIVRQQLERDCGCSAGVNHEGKGKQSCLGRRAVAESIKEESMSWSGWKVMWWRVLARQQSSKPAVFSVIGGMGAAAAAGGGGGAVVSAAGITEMIVPAQGHAELGTIRFTPEHPCGVQGLAFIRNNLTFLESITLTGDGASGHLELSKNETVQLTVSASHLGLSERELQHMKGWSSLWSFMPKRVAVKWPVHVHRSIKVVNTGNLPLDVSSILFAKRSFGQSVCKSRVFSISPCDSFTLSPRQSKSFQLTFSPDLSAMVTRQDLVFETSAGEFKFAVVGQMARHLISICLNVAPRYAWEPVLHKLAVALVSFFVFFLWRLFVRELTVTPAPWMPGLSAAAAAALTRRLNRKNQMVEVRGKKNNVNVQHVRKDDAAETGQEQWPYVARVNADGFISSAMVREQKEAAARAEQSRAGGRKMEGSSRAASGEVRSAGVAGSSGDHVAAAGSAAGGERQMAHAAASTSSSAAGGTGAHERKKEGGGGKGKHAADSEQSSAAAAAAAAAFPQPSVASRPNESSRSKSAAATGAKEKREELSREGSKSGVKEEVGSRAAAGKQVVGAEQRGVEGKKDKLVVEERLEVKSEEKSKKKEGEQQASDGRHKTAAGEAVAVGKGKDAKSAASSTAKSVAKGGGEGTKKSDMSAVALREATGSGRGSSTSDAKDVKQQPQQQEKEQEKGKKKKKKQQQNQQQQQQQQGSSVNDFKTVGRTPSNESSSRTSSRATSPSPSSSPSGSPRSQVKKSKPLGVATAASPSPSPAGKAADSKATSAAAAAAAAASSTLLGLSGAAAVNGTIGRGETKLDAKAAEVLMNQGGAAKGSTQLEGRRNRDDVKDRSANVLGCNQKETISQPHTAATPAKASSTSAAVHHKADTPSLPKDGKLFPSPPANQRRHAGPNSETGCPSATVAAAAAPKIKAPAAAGNKSKPEASNLPSVAPSVASGLQRATSSADSKVKANSQTASETARQHKASSLTTPAAAASPPAAAASPARHPIVSRAITSPGPYRPSLVTPPTSLLLSAQSGPSPALGHIIGPLQATALPSPADAPAPDGAAAAAAATAAFAAASVAPGATSAPPVAQVTAEEDDEFLPPLTKSPSFIDAASDAVIERPLRATKTAGGVFLPLNEPHLSPNSKAPRGIGPVIGSPSPQVLPGSHGSIPISATARSRSENSNEYNIWGDHFANIGVAGSSPSSFLGAFTSPNQSLFAQPAFTPSPLPEQSSVAAQLFETQRAPFAPDAFSSAPSAIARETSIHEPAPFTSAFPGFSLLELGTHQPVFEPSTFLPQRSDSPNILSNQSDVGGTTSTAPRQALEPQNHANSFFPDRSSVVANGPQDYAYGFQTVPRPDFQRAPSPSSSLDVGVDSYKSTSSFWSFDTQGSQFNELQGTAAISGPQRISRSTSEK